MFWALTVQHAKQSNSRPIHENRENGLVGLCTRIESVQWLDSLDRVFAFTASNVVSTRKMSNFSNTVCTIIQRLQSCTPRDQRVQLPRVCSLSLLCLRKKVAVAVAVATAMTDGLWRLLQ